MPRVAPGVLRPSDLRPQRRLVDTVSVIDMSAPQPHVIDTVVVGDVPEGQVTIFPSSLPWCSGPPAWLQVDRMA